MDWRPQPVLPHVYGREGRLRAMFKQLIDNALDALDGRRGARELHIVTAAEEDALRVVIEDTGPGIPEDLRYKVFEPFFTTKRGGGSRAGMGLPMVQDVINEHAGTLEIDGEFSQGCRIILRLPLQADAVE